MLRPQRMLKFVIIVPAEYEMDLLNAIVDFGTVHTSYETKEITSTLPPLMRDVLEGKIGYKELDIESAIKFLEKTLDPNDKLAIEVNKIREQYKILSNLRRLPPVVSKAFYETLKVQLGDIKLPEWAFHSLNNMEKAINEKVDELKKRIYEILLDLSLIHI